MAIGSEDFFQSTSQTCRGVTCSMPWSYLQGQRCTVKDLQTNMQTGGNRLLRTLMAATASYNAIDLLLYCSLLASLIVLIICLITGHCFFFASLCISQYSVHRIQVHQTVAQTIYAGLQPGHCSTFVHANELSHYTFTDI